MIIQATKSGLFLLQSGSGSAREKAAGRACPCDSQCWWGSSQGDPKQALLAPMPVSWSSPLTTSPLLCSSPFSLLPSLSRSPQPPPSPSAPRHDLPASLSASSSLPLPLLPSLFPRLHFSFPSFSFFPLPHPPIRYSRTIEQMAGCLFYMSLRKISSAVDSVTFSKNRHRPTLAECWGKGRGVWRSPAIPTSCTETLSICTPRNAFGKEACPRAQR